LSKELLFVGSLNKVEIWSSELYEDADAEEVGAMLEEMEIEF